jgi:hypothetical protein
MLPPSSWYKMEMEATFLFNISTFIPQFSSIIKTPGVDITLSITWFLDFPHSSIPTRTCSGNWICFHPRVTKWRSAYYSPFCLGFRSIWVFTVSPLDFYIGLQGYLHSFCFKFLYHFSFIKIDLNGLESYSWLALFDDGHQLLLTCPNEADSLSPEDRSRSMFQNMFCSGH